MRMRMLVATAVLGMAWCVGAQGAYVPVHEGASRTPDNPAVKQPLVWAVISGEDVVFSDAAYAPMAPVEPPSVAATPPVAVDHPTTAGDALVLFLTLVAVLGCIVGLFVGVLGTGRPMTLSDHLDAAMPDWNAPDLPNEHREAMRKYGSPDKCAMPTRR